VRDAWSGHQLKEASTGRRELDVTAAVVAVASVVAAPVTVVVAVDAATGNLLQSMAVRGQTWWWQEYESESVRAS